MAAVSYAIKQHIAEKTPIKAVKFMTANILYPPKKDVLTYLGIPTAPGTSPEEAPESLPRRAEMDVCRHDFIAQIPQSDPVRLNA